MEESILSTIRGMVGPDVDYGAFDIDLITHINTFLGILNQNGIGTKDFYIEDEDTTWADFLGQEPKGIYNGVKTYIYLNTRLVFDCPSNSTMVQEMKAKSDELLWRLREQHEYEGSIGG